KGSEIYTLRIRDLATGRDLPEVIPDTRGSLVWARDSTTLFYVRLDEAQRPLFVYRHRTGTPADRDTLVYAEPDSGFFVSIDETQSGRFVLVYTHDHETSEVWLIDSSRPESPPRVVAERRPRHEYSL